MSPEETPGGGADPGRDRGFKARKREDHALQLIEELRQSLGNLPRVRRILLELGRFYDPVLGGGIMDLESQKRVVAALEQGRTADAEAVIQARYDLYIKDRAHLGRRDGA